LATSGPNELPEAPPHSPLSIFLAQFSSVIVWVLVGAAVVSGLLEEWGDTVAIVAIVALNALLGFVQEFRAERSLEALKRMIVVSARVTRDGIQQSLPARELVPGDLIEVEAGDRIPADARVFYSASFQTQEASLTGESTPVVKAGDRIPEAEVPLGDRRNVLYMGTVAVSGKARAVVVETGERTELGKIAAMIQEAAQAEHEETPLQRRLEQLGHTLLWLSLGVVAVVFSLGLLRGIAFVDMFMTSISLAVAAIPEGLPAVVTITLALGVTRMVKRHALIRKLPAVETLGSTTVICTDKTGTLTKNEMTVTRLFMDHRTIEVTGEGYAPQGELCEQGRPLRLQDEPGMDRLLNAAVLCNGAALTEQNESWQVLGDPTEGALLVVAAKVGLKKDALEVAHPTVREVPFDPERKMMTIVRGSGHDLVAYVKGAPDVLLEQCSHYMTAQGEALPLSREVKDVIQTANGGFAKEALRVLGVAERSLPELPVTASTQDLEQDLVFLGLMAMKDPLRPEAMVATRSCKDAGIRTVMITGDHKETAVAIANDLGIMGQDMRAISGEELSRLSDDELRDRVPATAVYARVSAQHKLRVVRAWKQQGAVVAMTGDGVNDAPALKAADIGVAMGLTGTDVTKEASDMVVTDDNFASIAAAVEEGRAIYDNIRKAVHYLLSCNISEILLLLLATLFALPLPLLPVQILWINLVTDGLPALALAVDPADPDLMRRPPRRPQARILDRERILVMFGQGVFMAAITLLSFIYCLYGMDQDLDRARTLTFTVLVMVQLFHASNCRNDRLSLFVIGPFANRALVWTVVLSILLQAAIILTPPVRAFFKVVPFDPHHWLFAFGVGVLPLAATEVWKFAGSSAVSPAEPSRKT
jgi:Ca2+-transporting ATPase